MAAKSVTTTETCAACYSPGADLTVNTDLFIAAKLATDAIVATEIHIKIIAIIFTDTGLTFIAVYGVITYAVSALLLTKNFLEIVADTVQNRWQANNGASVVEVAIFRYLDL